MWGRLSNLGSVSTSLRGRLAELKQAASELTSEVLADVEESEAAAREQVEAYKEKRRREGDEQPPMHTDVGQEQQHYAQSNGLAADSPSSSHHPPATDHFASFSTFSSPLHESTVGTAPTPGTPSSFPPSCGAAETGSVMHHNHDQPQSHQLDQAQSHSHHPAEQHQHDMNGYQPYMADTAFSQTPHTVSDHISSNAAAMSDPSQSALSNPFTPAPLTPVLHQKVATSESVNDHEHDGEGAEVNTGNDMMQPHEEDALAPVDVDMNGGSIAHPVDTELTPDGPMLDVTANERINEYSDTHEEVPQPVSSSLHPSTDIDSGHGRHQRLITHLQTLLFQAQSERGEMERSYESRLSRLQHECRVKEDELSSVREQQQENRSKLMAELEQREEQIQQMQQQYATLMQRYEEKERMVESQSTSASLPVGKPLLDVQPQPPSSIEPESSLAASNTSSIPFSLESASEDSLDVQAVLRDSSLSAEEKVNMLVEEIEVLSTLVAEWKQKAMKSQQSTQPAASAPTASTPADSTPTAIADHDSDSSALIESLRAEIDDLNERLESVSDEKEMLSQIMSELRGETEKAVMEATAQAKEQINQQQDTIQRLQQQVAALQSAKARDAPSDSVAPTDESDEVEQLRAELQRVREENAILLQRNQQDAEELAEVQQELFTVTQELQQSQTDATHTESSSDSMPSPSINRTPMTPSKAVSSLRHKVAALQKSNDKLLLFRSQAIAWKQQADQVMHRLLTRKEELRKRLKQNEISWTNQRDLLVQQCRRFEKLALKASGGNMQPSTSVEDQSSGATTSIPTDELVAQHALTQAQLDLAHQQLSMALDQIAALQSHVHDLESKGTNEHADDHAAMDRLRAEFLSVNSQLSDKLAEVESSLRRELADAHEQHRRTKIELSDVRDQLDAKIRACDLLGNSLHMAQDAQHEAEAQLQEMNERHRRERDEAEQRWQEQLRTMQDEWKNRVLEARQEVESLQARQVELQQEWSTQQTKLQQEWSERQAQLEQELQSSRTELEQAQAKLQSVASEPTPSAPSPTHDESYVSELQSQLSSLQEKSALDREDARQHIAHLNERYEQLLANFSQLQAQCRAGLDGEEGQLAQIAEQRSLIEQLQAAQIQQANDARAKLEELTEELASVRAEAKKVEQSRGEASIMSMRLREAMSEADALRKTVREQAAELEGLRNGYGGSDGVGAPSNLPASDLEAELHSLRAQVKSLQLDASSSAALQSDYAALQRNFAMTQTMLNEDRASLEEARKALRETQSKLHEAQEEMDALKARKDEMNDERTNAATVVSSQTISELHDALNSKTDQLVEMQHYVQRLEQDNLTLRQSFELTLAKLKHFSEEEEMVDRRLVVKLLVTYIERKEKEEVLSLMARMLHFSKEDEQRIQQARRGMMGILSSLLSPPPASTTSPIDGSNGTPASLSESFIDFLLQESNKAEAEMKQRQQAAAKSNDGSNGIQSSVRARLAAQQQQELEQQSSRFHESEFESRPNRPAQRTQTPPPPPIEKQQAQPQQPHTPPHQVQSAPPAQSAPVTPANFRPPPTSFYPSPPATVGPKSGPSPFQAPPPPLFAGPPAPLGSLPTAHPQPPMVQPATHTAAPPQFAPFPGNFPPPPPLPAHVGQGAAPLFAPPPSPFAMQPPPPLQSR